MPAGAMRALRELPSVNPTRVNHVLAGARDEMTNEHPPPARFHEPARDGSNGGEPTLLNHVA